MAISRDQPKAEHTDHDARHDESFSDRRKQQELANRATSNEVISSNSRPQSLEDRVAAPARVTDAQHAGNGTNYSVPTRIGDRTGEVTLGPNGNRQFVTNEGRHDILPSSKENPYGALRDSEGRVTKLDVPPRRVDPFSHEAAHDGGAARGAQNPDLAASREARDRQSQERRDAQGEGRGGEARGTEAQRLADRGRTPVSDAAEAPAARGRQPADLSHQIMPEQRTAEAARRGPGNDQIAAARSGGNDRTMGAEGDRHGSRERGGDASNGAVAARGGHAAGNDGGSFDSASKVPADRHGADRGAVADLGNDHPSVKSVLNGLPENPSERSSYISKAGERLSPRDQRALGESLVAHGKMDAHDVNSALKLDKPIPGGRGESPSGQSAIAPHRGGDAGDHAEGGRGNKPTLGTVSSDKVVRTGAADSSGGNALGDAAPRSGDKKIYVPDKGEGVGGRGGGRGEGVRGAEGAPGDDGGRRRRDPEGRPPAEGDAARGRKPQPDTAPAADGRSKRPVADGGDGASADRGARGGVRDNNAPVDRRGPRDADGRGDAPNDRRGARDGDAPADRRGVREADAARGPRPNQPDTVPAADARGRRPVADGGEGASADRGARGGVRENDGQDRRGGRRDVEEALAARRGQKDGDDAGASRRGPRDGDAARGPRDGDAARGPRPNQPDTVPSADARGRRPVADGGDGASADRGARGGVRDNNAPVDRRGPRDGEPPVGDRRGPREGELPAGDRRGPRDGEAPFVKPPDVPGRGRVPGADGPAGDYKGQGHHSDNTDRHIGPRDGKDRALPPGLQDGRLALDLRDPKNREILLDAISKHQANKLDMLGEKGQKFNDIFKDLGPERVNALKNLLQDTHGQNIPRFDTKFDMVTQTKVKDLLDVIKDAGQAGRKSDIHDFSPATKSTADRLSDLIHNTERNFKNPDNSRNFAIELNKILKDFNREMGLEPGKGALTIKDVLGRNFDEAARAAEKGILPGQLPNQDRNIRIDNVALTLKPSSMDDPIVRVIMDKVANKAAENTTQRTDTNRPDNARPDIVRAEISTNRPEPKSTDINTAIKAEDVSKAIKDLVNQPTENSIPSQIKPTGKTTDSPTNIPAKDDLAAMQNKLAEERRLEIEKRDKEKKEIRDKEEAEREEKADKLKQLSEAAALLAAQKLKDRKELEQRLKEEKKLAADQRTKYVVKKGDTLESIAAKMLRDKRLAGLIYEINKKTIPIRTVRGKNYVALRPGLIIYLPSGREVSAYRGSLLTGSVAPLDVSLEEPKFDSVESELEAVYGSNAPTGGDAVQQESSLDAFTAEAIVAAKARRANVEKLLGPLAEEKDPSEPTKYVVRLGDTLKSIAVKHPLLQDVRFWRLLARVNNISTEAEEKGAPAAILKRGMSLLLPNHHEIERFAQEQYGLGPVVNAHAELKLPPKPPEPVINVSPISHPPKMAADVRSFIEDLGEAVRLVKSGDTAQLNNGFKSSLEVFEQDKWTPVVSYEIYEDVALRHEFLPDGARRTVRIGLPPGSAIELAENDLSSNWRIYCDKYLTFNR